MGRYSAITALAAAVAAGAFASRGGAVAAAPGITASQISGVRIHMTQAVAVKALPKPVEVMTENFGFRKVTSHGVVVYFHGPYAGQPGYVGAQAIITWSSRLRTAEGVGPCSTVAALRKTYGDRLKPFRVAALLPGRKLAGLYSLGSLFFTVTPAGRVGAVGLSFTAFGVIATENAPQCA